MCCGLVYFFSLCFLSYEMSYLPDFLICPLCSKCYGTRFGTQPAGKMKVSSYAAYNGNSISVCLWNLFESANYERAMKATEQFFVILIFQMAFKDQSILIQVGQHSTRLSNFVWKKPKTVEIMFDFTLNVLSSFFLDFLLF